MRFASTRGGVAPVGFSRAILTGLAPDGGLYVPERFPRFRLDDFDGLDSFPAIAARFLAPFLDGDPLAPHLEVICERAFDFPLVQRPLRGTPQASVLELFHGPTAAFKDFGARFLAASFEELLALGDRALEGARALRILVATSGDTGSAVAAAFHGRPGIDVIVLFPAGGVSPRQERQLTCWGGNVRSFAVRGSFDDCQRMAKRAFREGGLGEARLTSANSINVGRLLPQAAYYAASSLLFRREHGIAPGYVVPSGNLGNAVGAFFAKRSGLPIGRIALATNANRPVPDWFETGEWRPRPSQSTLANAMDVGDPSNMERLLQLHPERSTLLADALAISVGDAEIRATIAGSARRDGEVWCPHTATAVHALDRLPAGAWVVVATAHPAKFDTIVEPLIGRPVDVPPALAELLSRPSRVTEIDADLGALRAAL